MNTCSYLIRIWVYEEKGDIHNTRKQLILTQATGVEAIDSKQSAVLSGIARRNRGDKEGRRQATVVAVVLKSEGAGHVWGPRLFGHVSLKTDPFVLLAMLV